MLATLALVTAGTPLATGMYLPALPHLAASLDASSGQAQLTLSTFLAGVATGQMLSGTMSDRLGRRRVILAGSTSFVGFSLMCATAPGIDTLVAARFGEGVACGCGVAVSRAVVSDVFDSRSASRSQTVLVAAMNAPPLVAPLIGQAVLTVGSWRGVFVLHAVLGVLHVVGVLHSVPETDPRPAPDIRRATVEMFSDRVLVGHVLALSLCGAAAFAYIGGATFLLQGGFGLSGASASIVYSVNAAGGLAGSMLFGVLTSRLENRRTALFAATMMLGAIATLTVLIALGLHSLPVTWGCLFLFVAAFGTFLPSVTMVGMERGGRAPGVASSLLSAPFLIGAVITALTSRWATGDGGPMVLIMTLCVAGATLALALSERRHRCHQS